MAGRKDIEAGKAYVTLYGNNSQLLKSLSAVGARMQSFGTGIARLGGMMTALGGGLSAPFVGAIKAASDMEETMSKFSVVFGANADAVKAWSDNLAGSVGRSKQQIAAFMAGSQDLFVPLGFAADAATALSKQVTALAIDLGSFNNMADEDVMRDLQAALTGSGEVMKKYGVIVSEAAVKQNLLNQGLDPKAATDQQKVQARLNIIMAGTTAAQGDAIRTAGGFANQMKALQGNIKDAAVAIGQALLPVVTPLVTQVSTVVKVLGSWAVNNTQLIKTAAMVAAGIALAGAAFVGLGGAIALAGAAVSGLATLFGVLTSPITLVVAAIAGLVAAFFTLTDTGRWAADEMMADFGEAWQAIKDTLGGISDALAAGDLGLAAKIAMTGVKLAFYEATKSIRTWWIEMNKGLVQGLANAATSILSIWRKVSQTIAEKFSNIMYKVTLWTSGQKDYLTDAERTGARDSALNAYYDDLQNRMQTGIDNLNDGMQDYLDSSLEGGDQRIEDLKSELSGLRSQAGEAVERVKREREQAPEATQPILPGGAAGGLGKAESAVTFSAAAAVALGQGGGPMAKLVQIGEDQKKLLEQQVRTGAQVAQAVSGLPGLLLLGP